MTMPRLARVRARPWRTGLLFGLLIAYSAVRVAHSVHFAWQQEGADVRTLLPGPLMFRAAERWPQLAHDWMVTSPFTPSTVGWNYGPVPHFLLLPFVLVPSKIAAMRMIFLIDVALALCTLLMWVRLLFPTPLTAVGTAVLAGLWLNYFPLLDALTGREIEIFELFLVTAAIWALRRNREVLAGAALGVAAMTKFLPAIFIPYLVIKGRWKACGAAVATLGAIAIAAHRFLGLEHSTTFSLLRSEAEGAVIAASVVHQAIANVLYKMFVPADETGWHLTARYLSVLRPLALGLQMGVLALCGWFVWRWRRSPLVELEMALLAIVMVAVLPHANNYYLVFTLPALSIGLAFWVVHPPTVPGAVKIAVAGGMAAAGFLVPMAVLERLTGIPALTVAYWLQRYSVPAVGSLLAAAALLGLHRAAREQLLPALPGRPR